MILLLIPVTFHMLIVGKKLENGYLAVKKPTELL